MLAAGLAIEADRHSNRPSYMRFMFPKGLMQMGLIAAALNFLSAFPARAASTPYDQWKNGPGADPSFFPIGVWLQDPRNAEKYKAAGINLYIALWKGPTTNQLDALAKAGLRVICSQNKIGLENKDNPVIAGWMHGDEPDNAQAIPNGKGYGPPILPEKIIADYERIRAADPTRPVLLNLGQGVAYDNYIGRGVRRNHPEDYREYIKGCDIASFDIYPVVHDSPEVIGKLEYVPNGVRRLIEWGGGKKAAWNCIECTHIGGKHNRKATPEEVRSEVWMSLIAGSQGIIYFVHQFEPAFREAALLDDPEMLRAVTALNHQIHELAPVLNGPTLKEAVELKTADAQGSIATMVKRHDGQTYLFAANLRNAPTDCEFKLKQMPEGASVEIIGEDRKLALTTGSFKDQFKPYGVNLYRVAGGQ